MSKNLLKEETPVFKIKIQSNPKNITVVESFVEKIKEEYKIGEEIFGNILVAVTEAVNNAIMHGNKADHTKKVDVFFKKFNGTISFVVKDEGPGFNYQNLPDPTAPENIEKPAGRGVFLMKHLTDDLIFNDNGNNVELLFKMA